jgi:AcrR family transcriptional regulator
MNYQITMRAAVKKKTKAGRTYAGQSPEERRKARRADLLRAGFALFGGKGYASTTVEQICKRAGVIPRYFYESFESREALLTEVFTSIVEDAEAAVLNAISSAPSAPLARASAVLGAFVHSYLDDPRRARIVCMEVGGVSPTLERLRWTEMRRFAHVIELECERLAIEGVLPKRSFRMGAVALAGATNQLMIDWLSQRERPPVEAVHAEVVLLFASVLEGLSPALARLSALPSVREGLVA